MQAKTLLQIGFAPHAFSIFTHENELEHSAQTELERNPPQSLDSKRIAITEQLTQDRKRRRTSDSGSELPVSELSGVMSLLSIHTRALMQSQFPMRWWNSMLDTEGIAARCALAAFSARGKTGRVALRSGTPQPNCVHMTGSNECSMHDNLAFCYYCHQPLCHDHRLLVCEAQQEGKKLGSTSCYCLDMVACNWRANEQIKVVWGGMDADAQGTTIKRESALETPPALADSLYPPEAQGVTQPKLRCWAQAVP